MSDTNTTPAVDQVHTIESLAAAFASQQAQLDALKLENAQLKSTIKVDAPVETPKIPGNVKVGGVEYKWQVAHFHLPGEVAGETTEYYTAEEASTDVDVLKKILAIKGQGLLKALV